MLKCYINYIGYLILIQIVIMKSDVYFKFVNLSEFEKYSIIVIVSRETLGRLIININKVNIIIN